MPVSRPSRRFFALTLICAWLALGQAAALAADRVLIIGATSRSAAELIPQALERGHEVTALARRPDAVGFEHERLTVVKGDVYDVDSLIAAMRGDEVVISMVGPRVDPMKEVEFMDLYTVGTANIMQAMRAAGDERLLVASSLAVENELPTEKPALDDLGTMWIWNARRLYRDMQEMEVLVRDSGLGYVILRPPFLVEEPARGDLKVSVNTDSPKQTMLTFADFAAFVLDQVEGDQYLNTTVGLYSDRKLQWGENADFEKLAEQAKKDREAAAAQ
ncbi:MAG: NAD(P)H-binding protein [Chromatiales bacterium]|nr:MAG: NAD(P)H-binding protein [Chromatiales bacterium]